MKRLLLAGAYALAFSSAASARTGLFNVNAGKGKIPMKHLLTAACAFAMLTGTAGAFERPITPKDVAVVANEMGKTLPMMIDKETELSGVGSSGMMLMYKYTMVNYPANAFDPGTFKSWFMNNTAKTACTSSFRKLLDAGVEATYIYTGNDKVTIVEIDLTAADCLTLVKK